MLFALAIHLIFFTGSSALSQTLPRVVWWTEKLYPHLKAPTTVTCATSKCEVTTMQKIPERKSSRVAFIFYGSDFYPENLPLPRKSTDIWALLHEESPMNNYFFSHSIGIRLFNVTSTFSRHSNYPLTTQFLPSVSYLTQRTPIPTSIKNSFRRKGLAPVAYVQSHCHVASDRDTYVIEMMKHIDVDSYGGCLHNKDLPQGIETTESYDSEAFFNFLAQYKFVIAFENALCDDYITEKLFRSLHVGVVPIYWGSSSVKDWEPLEKSLIIVNDFATPKDLAIFLLELEADDSRYEEYLGFKKNVGNEHLIRTLTDRKWGVNEPNMIDFIGGFECFVCDSLVSSKHIELPNRTHMNCQQPRPAIELDTFSSNEWTKEDWIERYWYSFDEAKAVKHMIEANETSSSNFFNYLTKLKYSH